MRVSRAATRRPRHLALLAVPLFASIVTAAGCGGCPRARSGPLTPAQAIERFTIAGDLRIEVFAAEPHVRDPVELAFDEHGRAFVVEMLDYPFDPLPDQPGGSRIRLLEDADGDGRIDRSTVFADDLRQASSIHPWDGGLLVAAAPDILYLKDTTGDGRADLRRTLFTGFSLANPQHRVSSLRFAIDNWFYAANDGQPGEIASPERPGAPAVPVLGADVRFLPDRGELEAAGGPAQFGMAFDDWGHRFVTHNTVHVRHVVLPRRYLARNPFLPAAETAGDISDHGLQMFQLTPPEAWRRARTGIRQRRYDEQRLHRHEHAAGVFTGASGGALYVGDTLPEEYVGNLFTGEVAGNLVHRDVIRSEGATFIASRAPAERDREFLASTDPWFRPASLTVGPDGHLYVVDMYRGIIESPEYIPDAVRAGIDFRSGTDLGRIYRIVPARAERAPPPRPDLGAADASALVGALAHPNQWWRLTAQRLLVERRDPAAAPLLRRLAASHEFGPARVHALHALDALEALDAELVRAALESDIPGVREHGVRLGERFPGLASALAGMVDDESARVRFQLVLSLGGLPDAGAREALAALAARHGAEPWFRSAILSSPWGSSAGMLALLLRDGRFFRGAGAGEERFLAELATVAGARQERHELGRLVRQIAEEPQLGSERLQAAALEGLAAGLALARARRLGIPGSDAPLARLVGHSSPRVRSAARAVARHFVLPGLAARAAGEALDRTRPAAERIEAAHLLAGAEFSAVRATFDRLLAEHGPDLQEGALAVLDTFDDPDVAGLVIARWQAFGPTTRARALDVLLRDAARAAALLDTLEDGRIDRTELDPPQRRMLLEHPDATLRARAEHALRGAAPAPRQAVLERYRGVLGRRGDPARGAATFGRLCAACHAPADGRAVGPDLRGVSNRSHVELLEAIVDPSAAISPEYTSYIVTTREGRVYTGLLAAETPGAITIRRQTGDERILRAAVVEMRPSRVSLMPDGLEAGMSEQDLADLLAFLTAG